MSKADKVKAAIKESIEARKILYDFLDANPKGKGNEAYDYLVRRGIPQKISIETIKEYGKEHHTGEQHTHNADEEISGPPASDNMVHKPDELPAKLEKHENDPLDPIQVKENELSSDVGKVRGQPDLNAYKESINTTNHMAEDEVLKPEDIKEQTETEDPVVKTTTEPEVAEEDQRTDVPTNSSNCKEGSET